jgi:DHA1 family tetracycline resistance protein-like MFS transporter
MSKRQPALGFIFVTLLLDIIGIGLIAPIVPKLIEQFLGGNVAEAAWIGGWISAVYAIMQFLFAPILGNLSDRYGRRPIILISLAGAALDYLLLAFAPNLVWLFIGRVIAGITGANISAVSAYIADVSPPEKRAQNFGLIGIAFGLGFIIGPALGGILGSIDLRLPFFVVAGITALNWLYGFFVLPESLEPRNRRAFSWARANPVGSLGLVTRYPIVASLTLSIVFTALAQVGLQTIWAYYTQERYRWEPAQVGWSLAAVGVSAAIVQGGLLRVILPWLGERRSVLVGLGVSAVALVLYGLATEGWMIYVILIVSGLGGIAGPAAQGLISRSVSDQEQGAIQGALSSVQTLTSVVGPLIAASLFQYFAPRGVPGASFFAGAVFSVIGLLLAWRAFMTHRDRDAEMVRADVAPPQHL